MKSKRLWPLAVLCVFALVAGACTESDDDDAGAEGTDETTGGEEGEEIARSGLLPDDGPCDPELEPYPIGIMTVFESQILSLIDQVNAAEAAVEAFNGRGGIGGHCMELTTCDTQFEPNGELDCARHFVDDGIVATVNDTTGANPEGVIGVTQPAGLPRVGISPGTEELGAENSYPISGGGVGSTFMMASALGRQDVENMAMIAVDTPQVQLLPDIAADLLEANGLELTGLVPVPAGTTDYQQFVLGAQDAGAEGAMLALGEGEATQILRAGEQLGTDLTFSVSLGSFGQADVEEMGGFAEQIVFNSEVPPATASLQQWPILADVIADLSATGEPELQRDQIKSSPVRSWISVNALVQVVENFGDPDDVSREAITAALEEAQDVEMYDLIPAWTPTGGTGEGLFGKVSNPWYYVVTFDAEAGEFVIADEQMNVVEEVAGNTDYPQP
jgi:ABC-type branched-subunit amino acid transport system substrate-binding protein